MATPRRPRTNDPDVEKLRLMAKEFLLGKGKASHGGFEKVTSFLIRVIDGEEYEEVIDRKTGLPVRKKASLQTRLKATACLREWTLDRVLGVVKETPKTMPPFDHVEELKSIAERKRQQKEKDLDLYRN